MKKYPIALWMLAIGAFAIGMTEFVIMGLLPNIAREFNVSIGQAGQLITGYALGVAFGGPILVLITYHMNRKYLLIVLMIIFICGNLMSSFSPNYTILMTSRIVTSLAHGSFFGVGSILAAKMVEPRLQGSAMAIMFTGLTLSNVLGVPFGTLVGQNFGWNMTFSIVAIVGFLALIGILIFVPTEKDTVRYSVKKELKILKEKKLWLTLSVTLFGFSSIFLYFTYISSILVDVSNIKENNISYLLILFGVGVTLGNVIGGKMADWHLNKALTLQLSTFIIYFIALYFIQFNGYAMILGIFVFGVIGFSLSPSLQFKSTLVSEEAPTLASTLNQSAFNLGNALGAFIGGLVITYLDVSKLATIAPMLTCIGLILLLINIKIEHKEATS